MIGRFHRFLGFGLLLVGTAIMGSGAIFVSPAEGPVPFRRDRVPLDEETMMALAERLAVLADAVNGKDAEETRRAAQLLALSRALDPVNKRARKILGKFEAGDHRASDGLGTDEARDWIRQTQAWLASSEAGADGHVLASCLADVLALRANEGAVPEAGAWTDWIAEVPEFEEISLADPVRERVPEVAEVPGIRLDSASVSVPLWKIVEKSQPARWKLGLSWLMMSGTWQPVENPKRQQFSLVIGDSKVNRLPAAEVAPLLLRLLGTTNGDLPNGATVRISSPELLTVLPRTKSQPFSAAAAVLVSAALTGTEPTGTIIGLVDASGKLTLPDGYWEQLNCLAPDQAPRVILPAAAAADLPSLLAMGKPEFFMDHEILLADDFEQLLELSAKTPKMPVQQAISSFGDILTQGKDRQPGAYVARSSVRRVLADLTQAAPFHASARMLAIQGAGDRPSYITRRVLFGELKIALEPAQWLVDHGQTAVTPAQQKQISVTLETCRSAVAQLLRYSEKADHPAIEQALEMLIPMRTLDRVSRSRTGNDDDGMSAAESAAYKAFLTAWKEFMEKLDPAAERLEE
jgi:hypothetical protein